MSGSKPALRRVGTTDLHLSRIGLGGYQLGPEPDEQPDVARAVRVIETAIELGINWLDTSENYLDTHNEEVIGAALAKVEKEFLVASKVAPGKGVTGGGSGFRHDEVHDACRQSLKRLGRDHIDVYFLHWPDRSGVPLEETWGAMAELADAGLVRAIGLSNYSTDDVLTCHRQRTVDAVQDGINLVDYLDARPKFATLAEARIAVTTFEPLASGILSGRTLDQVRAVYQGTRWEDSNFYRELLAPGPGEQCFAVADGIRPIADRVGATVAQIAIAWVLHQRDVTATLVGTRDGSHLVENVAGAQVVLADDVLQELEQLIPLGPLYAEYGSPAHG
jgi:aryl-alcohol dehydrogenase-like predicted oxidoreductase